MLGFTTDLPVGSPLCHTVLKTLQRWEQVLQKRLEIFGGPPSKYICTHLQDETTSPGPALLRHKALFEPSNTPFRYQHELGYFMTKFEWPHKYLGWIIAICSLWIHLNSA